MNALIYVVMQSGGHETYLICNCSRHPLTPLEIPLCSSSPSPERISFQFTRQKFNFFVEECQDSLLRLRQEVEFPAVDRLSFSIEADEVNEDSSEFYVTVYDTLQRIRIPDDALHCLAVLIVENATDFTRLDRIKNPSLKHVILKISIMEAHVFTTPDTDPEFENPMRQSLEAVEEPNCGMVPTSEKGKERMLMSITATGERNPGINDGYYGGERKRSSSEYKNQETCAICFEDIPEGSPAAQLPCSHVFHRCCIEQWLEVSHYCPMCRFEFPAD